LDRNKDEGAEAQGLKKYEVVIQVKPSSGIFQSTVALGKNNTNKVLGVSRINAYENQGDCIDSTPGGTLEIKSLCFCTIYKSTK
jgi:hypothetical protein